MRTSSWLVVVVLAACAEPGGGLGSTDAAVPRDAGGAVREDAGASLAPDGGHGLGAGADAGVDGGVDAGSDAFCASCVSSADCSTGELCLGGLEPRCTRDCSATGTCPGALTCGAVHVGMGPILGFACVPDDATCGTFVLRAGLVCGDTWSSYAQNVFATTCVGSCHRHAFLQADVQAKADAIRLEVERGWMPTDATLTAVERLRLLTWLACGAR